MENGHVKIARTRISMNGLVDFPTEQKEICRVQKVGDILPLAGDSHLMFDLDQKSELNPMIRYLLNIIREVQKAHIPGFPSRFRMAAKDKDVLIDWIKDEMDEKVQVEKTKVRVNELEKAPEQLQTQRSGSNKSARNERGKTKSADKKVDLNQSMISTVSSKSRLEKGLDVANNGDYARLFKKSIPDITKYAQKSDKKDETLPLLETKDGKLKISK